MKRVSALRLSSLLLLAACSAGCAHFLPLKDSMERFLGWVKNAGAWGPVVLAAACVPSCVLLLSGSVLTIGAGVAFGLLTGTVAVSVGSIAGASLAIAVGRTLARSWIEGKVAGNPRFQALDLAVARRGFKMVLLTRLSPVFPFNLLNYVFGLTRVRFRDYLLASWVGMLPGTILYVCLGSALENGFEELLSVEGRKPTWGETLLKYVGLTLTIFTTIYVTRVARKAFEEAVQSVP